MALTLFVTNDVSSGAKWSSSEAAASTTELLIDSNWSIATCSSRTRSSSTFSCAFSAVASLAETSAGFDSASGLAADSDGLSLSL